MAALRRSSRVQNPTPTPFSASRRISSVSGPLIPLKEGWNVLSRGVIDGPLALSATLKCGQAFRWKRSENSGQSSAHTGSTMKSRSSVGGDAGGYSRGGDEDIGGDWRGLAWGETWIGVFGNRCVELGGGGSRLSETGLGKEATESADSDPDGVYDDLDVYFRVLFGPEADEALVSELRGYFRLASPGHQASDSEDYSDWEKLVAPWREADAVRMAPQLEKFRGLRLLR
jgi:hypothetical protein